MSPASKRSEEAATTFCTEVKSFASHVESLRFAKTKDELTKAHQAYLDYDLTLETLSQQMSGDVKKKASDLRDDYRKQVSVEYEDMSILLEGDRLCNDPQVSAEEFRATILEDEAFMTRLWKL